MLNLNNRLFLVFAVGALVLFSTHNLQAAMLFETSFDYGSVSGELQNVTSQFSGSNNGNTQYVADGGLTYPGYKSAGGSGAFLNGGNSPAVLNMTDGLQSMQNTPGTYYSSILLKGHTDLWLRSWQWIVAHRANNPAKYGNEDDGASQYHSTGVTVDTSATNLFVAKIGIADGNDSLQIVANPDLSQGLAALSTALDAAPATTSRDISNGDASNFAQFSRAPGTGDAFFDEWRVATSLAEVIPEPTSLTLLGMAFLLPLLVIRKKKQAEPLAG